MRKPDFIIGDPPYLNRWYIIPRNPWFNIYLHQFLRDDDDRALHDHPWHSLSILLKGIYYEHVPYSHNYGYTWWNCIIFRQAPYPHRIELQKDQNGKPIPCWTLFITGPRFREWGFYCPKGWVHWQKFSDPADSGKVTKGCDQ